MAKSFTILDLFGTFGNWRTNSKSSTCFFGLSTFSFTTKDAQIQINQTSIEPVIDGLIGFYLYSVGYGKMGVAHSFFSVSVCFVTYYHKKTTANRIINFIYINKFLLFLMVIQYIIYVSLS